MIRSILVAAVLTLVSTACASKAESSDSPTETSGIATPPAATDATSTTAAAALTPGTCAPEGSGTVEVPDTVGLRLEEAVARIQLAGLNIVGTGVAGSNDPQDSTAVVRAQAPSAGLLVPLGSCVGFRTEAG